MMPDAGTAANTAANAVANAANAAMLRGSHFSNNIRNASIKMPPQQPETRGGDHDGDKPKQVNVKASPRSAVLDNVCVVVMLTLSLGV